MEKVILRSGNYETVGSNNSKLAHAKRSLHFSCDDVAAIKLDVVLLP